MKFLIFLLFITNAYSNVIDKDLAQSVKTESETYVPYYDFQDPNGAVVFYSDSSDPTLLVIEEVSIDDNDISDNLIVINRSNNAPQGIIRCESEKGTVSIQGNELRVSTTSLPLRFTCFGNGGNYKEAYMTIKKP